MKPIFIRFIHWLESMGQDPRTLPEDVLLYFTRFAALLFLLMLPLGVIGSLIMPTASLGHSKPMKPTPQLALLMFFFYAYMFLMIVTIISYVGSWRRLAAKFPAPKKFAEGQLFKKESGLIGGMNYNGILQIRVAESGISMRCTFPFNFFHRPMLIPWKEIKTINEVRILWLKRPLFIVGSPKIASFALNNKKLVALARETWEAERYKD